MITPRASPARVLLAFVLVVPVAMCIAAVLAPWVQGAFLRTGPSFRCIACCRDSHGCGSGSSGRATMAPALFSAGAGLYRPLAALPAARAWGLAPGSA